MKKKVCERFINVCLTNFWEEQFWNLFLLFFFVQRNVKGRNDDFHKIFNNLKFNISNKTEIGLLDHDFIFWMGDLNYRLNLEDLREGKKNEIYLFELFRRKPTCKISCKNCKPWKRLRWKASLTICSKPTLDPSPPTDLWYLPTKKASPRLLQINNASRSRTLRARLYIPRAKAVPFERVSTLIRR